MQISLLGLSILLSFLLFTLKVAGVGEMPLWSTFECFYPLWITLGVTAAFLVVILFVWLISKMH